MENEKLKLELRMLQVSWNHDEPNDDEMKAVHSHLDSKEKNFTKNSRLQREILAAQTIGKGESDSDDGKSGDGLADGNGQLRARHSANEDEYDYSMSENDDSEAQSFANSSDESELDFELDAFILAKATSILTEHDSVKSATSVLKQIPDDECSLVNKLIELQREKAVNGDWDIPCISEVSAKSPNQVGGESWKNFNDFKKFVSHLKGLESEASSIEDALDCEPKLQSVVVVPKQRNRQLRPRTIHKIPRIDKSSLLKLREEITKLAKQDTTRARKTPKYAQLQMEKPSVSPQPFSSNLFRCCDKSQRKICKQFLASLRKQMLATVDVKASTARCAVDDVAAKKATKVKRKLLKSSEEREEGECSDSGEETEVRSDGDNNDASCALTFQNRKREGKAVAPHDCKELHSPPSPDSLASKAECDMNMQEPLDAALSTAFHSECGKNIALADTKTALNVKADESEDTCGCHPGTKSICVAIDTDNNVKSNP